MNTNGGTGGEPRRFSRREFLGIAAAGSGMLVGAGYAGRALAVPPQPPTKLYKGKKIAVKNVNNRPELFIDDKRIPTVKNNGMYRAANFMFSPSPSLEDLARKLVDHQVALQQRRGLGG